MKIIILGAGKVGELLCFDLSKENHDITLIEQDEYRLEKVLNHCDIHGILGNGGTYQIQMEANVDKTDLFMALTENDELNMISCVLAKKLGAKQTIARVRNPEYSDLSDLMKNSLGITLFINPELQAALRCIELLEFPLAYSFESFLNNKISIVELKLSRQFPLINKSLIEFRNNYKNLIVCCVLDKNKISIPNGNFILAEDQHLFVTGPINELEKLYKDNGQTKNKIKSSLIIGGGLISEYLLKLFTKTSTKIKLLEIDHEKAEYLSQKYPMVEIVEADGTSIENLSEQRAENFDSILALSGIDEENIIISLIAKKLNIRKILTKISRRELIEILDTDSMGLQSIITPKRIIADEILQYVRALENSQGSSVEALYKIANDKVEALQFKVKENSLITLKPIKDLKLKNNILIVYIYRKGKVIFPTGNDQVKPNDRVIIVSTNEALGDIDEIIV